MKIAEQFTSDKDDPGKVIRLNITLTGIAIPKSASDPVLPPPRPVGRRELS
jgi:hypothetical protein